MDMTNKQLIQYIRFICYELETQHRLCGLQNNDSCYEDSVRYALIEMGLLP